MDRLVTVLEIIAQAKSLVPGLSLLGTLMTPEGKVMAFPIDNENPKFRAALDVISSWENARPQVDHRT